ncbi:MAG: hypothetical protein A2Y88_12780 [Chloroflexi bacterium RBG_13_48_10]|nr:MAG: hypothetical protein A2Y88_12780 [Chloroflexi bacterium RBG_13_48_10]
MKAMILDPQVKVYSSFDANAVSIASLPAGSEIEFGAPKRKAGKLWVPITLSTGQQAFIPGETRLFIIRQASLMQNNIDLHTEPSTTSMVKQQFARNTKVYILEVVKQENQDWVRVRDMNGMEGFIQGNTSIRVIQQKTKALGRKNMLSGVMWLIGGLVITFSGSSPASGGSFVLFGYGAILFGAFMLISGLVQFLTAPS